MTSAHPTLTDSLLKQALTELAGNPDGRYLVDDVLRTAAVTPQQGRLVWPFELSSRMAMVLAVALLMVRAFGFSGRVWPTSPTACAASSSSVEHRHPEMERTPNP